MPLELKKETIDTIPAKDFDTEILSIETGIDTSDATATANNIENGYTAYVNGEKISGTVTTSLDTIITAGSDATITDTGEALTVDRGYGEKIILKSEQQLRSTIPYATIASIGGVTSDKIVSGNTIFGIEGTAETGTEINNQDKEITENGTYTADEGYTGLGTVTVNVPQEGGSGDVKLFETTEEMQADTTAKEGDLAVVYHNNAKPSKSTDKLIHIHIPNNVVLDTSITNTSISTFTFMNDDNENIIRFEISKYKCIITLPSVSGIVYYSSDGITYNRTDTFGNDFVLDTEYYWNTIYTWSDAYGEFIQNGGMELSGLYQYLPEVNTNYMSLPLISDIQDIKNGTIIVKQSFANKYAIEDLKEVITNLYNNVYSSTYNSADFGIFQAGGQLYAVISTCKGTQSITSGNYANRSVVKMQYSESGQSSTLIDNTIRVYAYRSASQYGNMNTKFYLLDLENKTYSISSKYTGTTSVDNPTMTISDLETFLAKVTVNSNNDTSFTFDKIAASDYNSEFSAASCTPANTDIFYTEWKYRYAPTQLTVQQENQIIKGLIGYGQNGPLNGTYEAPDMKKLVKWYKSIDEMNTDTSVETDTLALVYNNEYEGIIAEDEITQIYLPETIVSDTKIYANSVNDRNITSCTLEDENKNQIDYFIYAGEAGIYDGDLYSFIAYYGSDDGITYKAKSESLVHNGGLTDEYIELGYSWDDEKKLLTLPTKFVLNPNGKGQLSSGIYNEASSKLFKKANYDFYGIYKFDGTSWVVAKNQLTATVSSIIPNETAYGSTGIITGDGTIYNNLDNLELLKRYYGPDNITTEYSYPRHILGMYNQAKLLTIPDSNNLVEHVRISEYTGSASNTICLMPYIAKGQLSVDGKKDVYADLNNDKVYVKDIITNAIDIEYNIPYLSNNDTKNGTIIILDNTYALIYTTNATTINCYKISLIENNITSISITDNSTNISTYAYTICNYDAKTNKLYYTGKYTITSNTKHRLIVGYINIDTMENVRLLNTVLSKYSVSIFASLTTNHEFVVCYYYKTSSSSASYYNVYHYGSDDTLIKSLVDSSTSVSIARGNIYGRTNAILYDDGTYWHYGTTKKMNKSTLLNETDTNYKNLPRFLDFSGKYGTTNDYGIYDMKTNTILVTYKSLGTSKWYNDTVYFYPGAAVDENNNLVLLDRYNRCRMIMYDAELSDVLNSDYTLCASVLKTTSSVVNALTGIYFYTLNPLKQHGSIISQEEYNTAIDTANEILGDTTE